MSTGSHDHAKLYAVIKSNFAMVHALLAEAHLIGVVRLLRSISMCFMAQVDHDLTSQTSQISRQLSGSSGRACDYALLHDATGTCCTTHTYKIQNAF